jgi:hypothetical protein
MSDEAKVLAKFDRNCYSHIRVSLTNWDGKKFVDVRVYDNDGSSTSKGFSIRPRFLPDLLAAVQEAEAALIDEIEKDKRGRR